MPFEDAIQEKFERKKLKYTELVAEARQRCWQHTQGQIGVKGFVAKSTLQLDFGIRGRSLKGVSKKLSEAAEKVSQRLWLRHSQL